MKRYYTSDLIPAAISVTPGYYVSTLNTPPYPPKLLKPNYDDPDTLYTIMSDKPFHGSMKRGYRYRFHDVIIGYKNLGSIAPRVTLATWFITVTDLSERVHS